MKLNRRNFIKAIGVTLAALATRRWVVIATTSAAPPVINIVECIIDDDEIAKHIEAGRMYTENDKLFCNVSFNSAAMQDTMTFVDENGKRYPYRELEAMLDETPELVDLTEWGTS